MAIDKKERSIQIQSIIYNNDKDALIKALDSIVNSCDNFRNVNTGSTFKLVYGDCSKKPLFKGSEIAKIKSILPNFIEFIYMHFGSNLGSAAGHNVLAQYCDSQYIVTTNPDVITAPLALINLYKEFSDPSVAMAEAKQLPVEHPKDYDPITGSTSWASTAFCMIKYDIFEKVNGFDSENFFLYCDDVDFSWRVRQEGYFVKFVPTALVFHDKKLTPDGAWMPSKAEVFYSAEAAVNMSQKWGNKRLFRKIMKIYRESRDPLLLGIASKKIHVKNSSRTPTKKFGTSDVRTFDGFNYTKHRFHL